MLIRLGSRFEREATTHVERPRAPLAENSPRQNTLHKKTREAKEPNKDICKRPAFPQSCLCDPRCARLAQGCYIVFVRQDYRNDKIATHSERTLGAPTQGAHSSQFWHALGARNRDTHTHTIGAHTGATHSGHTYSGHRLRTHARDTHLGETGNKGLGGGLRGEVGDIGHVAWESCPDASRFEGDSASGRGR